MNPKEAQGVLLSRLGVLIDVREEEELRESGIAEGALWMPISKIAEDHPDWRELRKTLSKDKIVMLYCRSGARSGQLAAFLAAEGYRTANVGGFKDWQAANLPWKKFP
ncbi:MAG: rhodanese-like domain-containing protein [Bdellovibrionales bacterium]|nr:rhodanese-like domain-containing protein [Bdellovibrionales bacterium]